MSLLNGHAFYSHAASLLKKLKNLHRLASEKHLFTFDEFLLTEAIQTNSCSLPVKKIQVTTKNLFSFDLADKERLKLLALEHALSAVYVK